MSGGVKMPGGVRMSGGVLPASENLANGSDKSVSDRYFKAWACHSQLNLATVKQSNLIPVCIH